MTSASSVCDAVSESFFPDDISVETGTDIRNGHETSWPDKLRQWARLALNDGRADLMTEVRDQLEDVMLECALEHTNGRKVEAAKLLGVGRNTLTRKLKERQEPADL